MQIVDIGRDNRAQILDPPHLFLVRHPEMFDGEPVIEPRLFRLKLFKRVQRQFDAHVAGAMHMDLLTLKPEGAGVVIKGFR